MWLPDLRIALLLKLIVSVGSSPFVFLIKLLAVWWNIQEISFYLVWCSMWCIQQNMFPVVKFRPFSPSLFYVLTLTLLWDTEFPVSITRKAASRSHGSFSGIMKWNANTSREISSLPRGKVKHLLFMDNCFKFYRKFALFNMDYKLINSRNKFY